MVFSSAVFIFAFLPILLGLYYFLNIHLKNLLLIVMSLLFYAWGEPKYCLLMIIVVFFDYIFALLIDAHPKYKKIYLTFAILSNVGILFYFKYTSFFLSNIATLFSLNILIPVIELPIGISFFTFQAMSYVIDVYRQDAKIQKNPFYVLLYVSLFPQLVAGPIVRYTTVEEEIIDRSIRISDVVEGIERFIIGLCKKVIIANQVGALADSIFGFDELNSIMIIVGGLAYSLQIYFDFSAYSDMAIGIGRMLGFHFEENFNYPYISKSITEFWRRWHISLSTWFRDYIYIPLGGNRKGPRRQIINLFVVWLTTGLWHGASWNFVLWGLFYFVLLVFEKQYLLHRLKTIPSFFQHFYVLVCVFLGWLLFRGESLSQCSFFFQSLFSFDLSMNSFTYLFGLLNKYGIFMIAGLIFSTPIYPKVKNAIVNHQNILINSGVYFFILLIIYYFTVLFLINSTYNPFIYFRF